MALASISSRATRSQQAAPPPAGVQPVAFAGHIGALHWPQPDQARDAAVLLVPALGSEARASYRAMWRLAEELAARGFTVLRYDHAGDGDSPGLARDADQLAAWRGGVRLAAGFLRAQTGARVLALGGLRLGATLAAVEAGAVAPDALLLLAPIVSGRLLARELQMAAALWGLVPAAEGGLIDEGLELSAATAASLKRLDLRKLGRAAAPVWTALGAPDPDLVAALGEAATAVPFEGLADLLADAHVNTAPEAVWQAASDWLEAALDGKAPRGSRPVGAVPPPAPARLLAQRFEERPVVFGAGLHGVLCLPRSRTGAQAVVFGNTGADPRAGIAGFAAEASRTLAARGVAALRFDFAGLGESRPPADGRGHVYETSRLPDFRAAAELLAGEGYDDLLLTGICSGGYQALQAAAEDPRFRRVLTVNSRLLWRAGGKLTVDNELLAARAALRGLTTAAGRRRVLAGALSPHDALRALKSFVLDVRRRRDADARAARAAIAGLVGRGGRLRVVMGEADETRDELEVHFGRNGRWLNALPGAAVRFVPGMDHALFSQASRDAVMAELLALLAEAPEQATATAA